KWTDVDYRKGNGEVTANKQQNFHPTVKPLAIIKYIANLIIPPKYENDTRKLLVPFSGSGSEIIGSMLAGWDEIHGFEKEEEYIEIAEARIEYWREHNLKENKKKR
ncbi:MAG: hypothetical protein ACOC1K_06850, partial [Nanoarchaeota archaeon]